MTFGACFARKREASLGIPVCCACAQPAVAHIIAAMMMPTICAMCCLVERRESRSRTRYIGGAGQGRRRYYPHLPTIHLGRGGILRIPRHATCVCAPVNEPVAGEIFLHLDNDESDSREDRACR